MSERLEHPVGWTVGQTVFLVINGRRIVDKVDCHIAKIGRKWITLDYPSWNPYRFDAETMRLHHEGYSSPGRVYPSREEYEASTLRQQLFTELTQRLSRMPYDGVTLEDIVEAARLLRVPIPVEDLK